jgi:hypothetical protein
MRGKSCCETIPCSTSTHDTRRTLQDWYFDAGVRDSLIDAALGHKPSAVLTKHYRRGKIEPDRLIRLFEADMSAHGLDAPAPVEQSAPVQPASELRSTPQGATDFAGRPKDGSIAQSVELRTFNSELPRASDTIAQDSAASVRGSTGDAAASRAVPPRSAAAASPTDEELERGILDALAAGLREVARTLSAQLDVRRSALTSKVTKRFPKSA